MKEIDCFFVEDERTYAHCQDGKQYLIRKRLYELEKALPGYYERISKSAIANWPNICRFRVQLSGAVDAVFAGDTGTSVAPTPEDVAGFNAYIENYKKCLPIEEAAVKYKN